jgi:hypothetical protein
MHVAYLKVLHKTYYQMIYPTHHPLSFQDLRTIHPVCVLLVVELTSADTSSTLHTMLLQTFLDLDFVAKPTEILGLASECFL